MNSLAHLTAYAIDMVRWSFGLGRRLNGPALALALASAVLVTASLPTAASAQTPQSRFADVNGVRMHYLVAGPITGVGHIDADRDRVARGGLTPVQPQIGQIECCVA